MATWLMDTALLKAVGSPKAANLQKWFEAHDASIFLSAASLSEIVSSIEILSAKQSQRGAAQQKWFNDLTARYADRIHQVDAELAIRAGALLPSLRQAHPRHRLHDALLVATAQIHGHGLLTRREGVFGKWTEVPVATF